MRSSMCVFVFIKTFKSVHGMLALVIIANIGNVNISIYMNSQLGPNQHYYHFL